MFGARAAPYLAGAALFFAATSGFAMTIGFSPASLEGDWQAALANDMRQEASEEGVDLKFADAAGNQDEQLKAVRAFIAQRVDAIVVQPVAVTGWAPALLAARQANVPVFVVGRDVDADKTLTVTRFAADFNLEGRLAGAWLAQASNGDCNIIELQGVAGAPRAVERKRGFEALVADFSEMKVVRTASGDFTSEGGKAAMAAFIKSTGNLKNICAVFAHNDDMQLGAIEAMKEAGLKPGKDVLMVSIDCAPAMRQALAAGQANACVERKSALGKYIYPIIAAYLKDKKEPPKWVKIPSALHVAAAPAR